MFNKDDVHVLFLDEHDDDIDFIESNNMSDKNPISKIVADIHKQQMKKSANLPKNTVASPAGVIVYEYIKLAGVKADPVKQLIRMLSNEEKFDPKILSDLSTLAVHDRMIVFAILFNSHYDHLKRNIKKDINKSQKLTALENEFKDIAFVTLQSIPQTKISSMNKEYHAIMCNPDTNPYRLNDAMKARFNILNQKLQHQVDESYSFDNVSACLVHNTMPPCKDAKCEFPHNWSLCGEADHALLDLRCPKRHKGREWYVKRMNEVNRYYNSKSRRTRNYNGNRPSNRNYQRYRNGHYPANQPPNTQPDFNNDDGNRD